MAPKPGAGRPSISIDASGVEDLVEKLEEISGENLKKNLRKAHRTASTAAAKVVKAESPVLTGQLQKSIKASPTSTMGRISIGAPQAGPVIFGWSDRNIEPHPFPFEAIDHGEDDILNAYEDGVNTLLEENGLT